MYFIDNIELNKSIYEIDFLIDCDLELSIILKSKENELKKILRKEYQVILNEISNEKKYHIEISIPKCDNYQIFLEGLDCYMVKSDVIYLIFSV